MRTSARFAHPIFTSRRSQAQIVRALLAQVPTVPVRHGLILTGLVPTVPASIDQPLRPVLPQSPSMARATWLAPSPPAAASPAQAAHGLVGSQDQIVLASPLTLRPVLSHRAPRAHPTTAPLRRSRSPIRPPAQREKLVPAGSPSQAAPISPPPARTPDPYPAASRKPNPAEPSAPDPAPSVNVPEERNAANIDF